MIVNSVIPFMVPRKEFFQLAQGIAKKWTDSIPMVGHEKDQLLIIGEVNGKVIQQVVFVTPEEETTVEEMTRKYFAGDYKSPAEPLDVKTLIGF